MTIEGPLSGEEALGLVADGLALRWRRGGSPVQCPALSDTDRAAFVALAGTHRVTGALYRQALDHEAVFSPELVRELGVASAFEALVGEAGLAEIRRALSALSDVGLPVIVTKGWALTASMFDGDPSIRPAGDIDLLVQRTDVDSARGALAGLGYERISPQPWPGFNERYRYADVLQRPDAGHAPLEVELHWGLLNVPYFERIKTHRWFERSEPIEIAGAIALAPALEDHFVYLCGHLALHHQYGRELFRYHDMAVLASCTQPLDWDVVLQRAADWRLVIPLGESLARLSDLWPEIVPIEVLSEASTLAPTVSERRVHSWMVERPRTPTSAFLLDLATMPGVRRRIGFVAEQAVPSKEYMVRRYPPRHPALWLLAYFQRAWRGVAQVVGRG